MAAQSVIRPEVIQTPGATSNTPNSHLPILVYRNVPALIQSSPENQQPIIDLAKTNGWYYGGTFKTYPTPHYHTVTHEAYAVTDGSSMTRYGVGPLDDSDLGITVHLQKGDIIVHAAGVAHANFDNSHDYEYIGFYPVGSPIYDNNFGRDPFVATEQKRLAAQAVPIPTSDIVNGDGGPLVQVWSSANATYKRDVLRVREAARILCG